MPATFITGPGNMSSSGPMITVNVHTRDLWPQGTRSGSGTKDTPTDGEHPVFAIGGMTAADGRPLNVTGLMISLVAGLATGFDIIIMNVADYQITSQYVDNTLTYAQGAPATFEQAPVIGQPVYVDDSDDLAEGTTLSLSELNEDDLRNPMAGILWYDQDEYRDDAVGMANVTSDWPKSWANSQVETRVSVLLINGWRELA